MDTKSKSYHKIAVVIILLTVMIPSLLLVGLYPQVENAMLDLKEEYDRNYEEEKAYYAQLITNEWALIDNFINYAVEANYCIYGELLEQATEQSVNWNVIDRYGWRDDYYEVDEAVSYEAVLSYVDENGKQETYEKINFTRDADIIGTLKFVYDAEGELYIELIGDIDWQYWYEIRGRSYATMLDAAFASTMQYVNNAFAYAEDWDDSDMKAAEFAPKNLTVVYTLDIWNDQFVVPADDMYGISDFDYYYNISPEGLFMGTGSYFVVPIFAAVVAIVALLLPCIKSLETGKEKIFSLPMEVMLVIAGCTIAGAVGMTYAMAYTNMYTLDQIGFSAIMGYQITAKEVYAVCIVGNVIGWALVFFGEYMVISNIRQFLCGMKKYLKDQTLISYVFGWMKKKIITFYRYVTNIDFKEDMNKSILKIVLINFLVLTILCCLWFFGVAALVVYSIVLFWLLQKVGKKWKGLYDNILQATEQMADGNLRISLEEDLGIFAPMGESLKQVQEGFRKAVVEEAKSQNMKSELITNVSHDLKTPLTAIITYVDLLKKEDITEEERKSYITTLDQKSQRLKVLIEDLFEVSKANSGNVKMNLAEIDVVSLLRQVRSEMDEDIQKSNLQFRWNLPEEKILLQLDGQRMYRVFENLIRNALKYAMPYSRVYVDVLANERDVQIVFRNMSAAEMNYDPEQLTERFVRGDVSRNSEGSGLGLAIVKSFVELQNGKFKIEVDGDLFKAIISFQK